MRIRDPHKEQSIRRKAMEMIVKKGFDGLSMQKLARAARLSPGTLYIYFKDREDLILQIYREEFHKTLAATMRDFDPGMPFRDGLRMQWLNRARFCMEHPLSMQFMEQFRHTPLHEKALKLGGDAYKEIMYTLVNNAIRKGELVNVPVEVYWAVAFAPMYQLVKFHLQGKSIPGMGKFALTEEYLLQTLDLVVKALTPTGDAPATRAEFLRAEANQKKSGRTISARPKKTQRKKNP